MTAASHGSRPRVRDLPQMSTGSCQAYHSTLHGVRVEIWHCRKPPCQGGGFEDLEARESVDGTRSSLMRRAAAEEQLWYPHVGRTATGSHQAYVRRTHAVCRFGGVPPAPGAVRRVRTRRRLGWDDGAHVDDVCSQWGRAGQNLSVAGGGPGIEGARRRR